MKSKVVLITGATSGIGKAIADYLSQKSFIVYGTGRNPKLVPDLKYQLIPMEVSDSVSIKDAIKIILDKEKKIDVLINNAGIGITGSIEDTSIEQMKKLFNINFFGTLDVIKSVLPSMRAKKQGQIINITSIAGYMGLPFRGGYSASKGALELISEALRMEVKPFGIDVLNIAPGDYKTEIASRRIIVDSDKSPYEENYVNCLQLINKNVNEGCDTAIIAKQIYQIIEAKSTKIHYKSGSFLEKFSIFLKRILSDKTFEKLLMNHYKL